MFHHQKVRLLGLFAALLLFAGCETAQVAAVTDPDFAAQPRAALTVVVAGPKAGLVVRQAAEQAAMQSFAAQGVRALSSLTLIPATQTATKEEEQARYRDAGADVLLLLEEFSLDTHQGRTPVHYTPGYWHRRVVTDKNGNQHIIHDYQPGHYSGGHSYTRTIGRYQARLIELATGRVMWRGDVDLTGGADYAAIAADAAEAAATRVMADGFFITKPAD